MNKATTQSISPIPIFDTLEQLHGNRIELALPDQLKSVSPKFQKDYQLAQTFLYSYRGSPATFNSYRRDIERLLQWTWFFKETALNQLKREDIEEFIDFCQKPPKTWLGLKNTPRFLEFEGERMPNPEWRPFVVTVTKKEYKDGKEADIKDYQLTQSALQSIFAILSSFFNFLIQEDYAEINPVAQMRQKSKYLRKQQHKQIIRRLTELQWGYVIETAELLADKNPAEHERTLFIMQSLFAMYLRISELSASPRWTPQMGDFTKDTDGHWWFTTVGKGNKERMISVSDDMLEALKRYRRALGFSPLPAPGDTTPLIMKNKGLGAITSTRMVRKIVQFCFDQSIHRLREDGFHEEAESLMSATVHWLRHTGISEDVKHRPREHVRDDAGHSSSAITDRYIDVEMRARHASARKKKIKPE
ncbi:MAG: site-specific integrase [Proteobacteria bacterium]|nr:site-specific integrase [Pseudomonadota bacterium]